MKAKVIGTLVIVALILATLAYVVFVRRGPPPALSVSPSSIDLSLKVGRSSELAINISNPGKSEISASLELVGVSGDLSPTSIIIPPRGSAQVVLRFLGASPGEFTGYLRIRYDTSLQEIPIKVTIRLIKIAMVLPGRIDDLSWNYMGWLGLQLAKEEFGDKIEVAYSEMVAVADAERVIRDYASAGYDLIWVHDFLMGDALFKVAKDFPDVHFVWGCGYHGQDPNVAYADAYPHEAAFLAGVLAAGMTETKKIGVVAAFDIPILISVTEAFKMGVEYYDSTVEVMEVWTMDWEDAAKAKEATLSMIDAGADVILVLGDGMAYGAIEACKERGVWIIGAQVDQHERAPELMLTSILWGQEYNVLNAIKDEVEGKFVPNKFYVQSLSRDGPGLAPYHELESVIPEDLRQLIEDLAQQIKLGQLEVPRITTH